MIRRLLRIAAATFAIVLVVVVSGLFWVLRTDSGHGQLASWIEAAAETPGEFSLRLEGLGGALPTNITIDRLALADGDGVWLDLNKVELSWRLAALLQRRVHVDVLGAKRLRMTRVPAASEEAEEPTEPFDWNTLPPMDLDRLSIGLVSLSGLDEGPPIEVSFGGDLHFETPEDAQLALQIGNPALADEAITLTAALSGEEHDTNLALRAALTQGSALATRVGAACESGCTLDLQGDGPWQHWTGALEFGSADFASIDTKLDAVFDDTKTTLAATFDRLEAQGVGLDGFVLRAEAPSLLVTTESTNADRYKVELTWNEVRIDAESVPAAKGPASLTVTAEGPGENQVWEIAPFTLAMPWGGLNGNATANLAEESWTTDVSLKIHDPAIPTGEAIAAGNLALDAKAKGSFDTKRIGLTANLRAQSLSGADWTQLAGESLVAAVEANLADDRWNISSLNIDGTGIHASAEGVVPAGGGAVEAMANIVLPNLALLSPTLAGTAALDAKVSGTMADLLANVEVTSPRVVVSGAPMKDLAIVLSASGDSAAPTGALSGGFKLDEGAVKFGTNYALEASGAARLSGLHIDGPRTTIDGNAAMNADGAPSAGLTMKADLTPWAKLGGVSAAGLIDADLALKADGTLRLQGEATGLTMPHTAAAPSAASLRFDARASGSGDDMNLVATATGTDVGVGPMKLTHLDANVTGKGPSWQIKLGGLDGAEEPTANADGTLGPRQDPALALSASIDVGDAVTKVQLHDLAARLGAASLSLLREASIESGPDGLRVHPLEIGLDEGGSVRVKADMLGDNLDATVELVDAPLALARWADPNSQLEGTLSATAVAHGLASAPSVVASATLAGLSVPSLTKAKLPPLGGTMNAQLDAGGTIVTARFEGFTQSSLSADLRLPSPFADDPGQLPIAGDIDLDVEISDFVRLLALFEGTLEGRIAGRMNLAGVANSPELRGEIRLLEGVMENPSSGTELHDISASILADGSAITLKDLSANDGSGGKLAMDGSVDLAAGNVGLVVNLNKLAAVRTDVVEAATSGRIAIDGTGLNGEERALAIVGDVKIDQAWIGVPKHLDGSGPELKVRERGGGYAPEPVTEPSSGADWIELAIKVRAAKQVYVRGRGMDSEWSTKLSIDGNASEPVLKGSLDVVRGSLELLGKRFKLTEGTIAFLGKGAPPELNIRAEATAEDVTAIVTIQGSATAPEIEIGSDPALPQDEVLARVLFGTSAGELTPAQSITLARSVAQLSGAIGNRGILDRVGDAVGVDRIAVGNDGENSNLSVGKYLSDDVYVSVEQGLDPTSSRVRVEVAVTKNLAMDSSVGQDSAADVGFSWHHDY